MIEIILPILLSSFILVGIHTYFGIHILKRGIIFADLAIAQIVAMGVAFAFLFNLNHFLSSLIFGLLGSILLSTYRVYDNKVIQEALIGISYVASTAFTILFLEKAPHGEEALRELFSGSLLWVTYEKLIRIFFVYLLIGLLHFKLWKKFLNLSEGIEKSLLFDIIFFSSFAFAVTYSVQTGGVLLVFSFLIIPPLISTFLFKNFILKLIFGWLIGILSSILGAILSYILDIPTGPAIVATLTFFLIIFALFNIFKRKSKVYL
ncbi:MAG: metal ABC transporter permease [Candidatus Hydrothermales bacterium]